MYEVIHQWSDGYGASLTFTIYPPSPSSVEGIANTATAHLTYEDDGTAGGYVDAADLRAIAAAALAAAEALSTEGS
jgi:hypothetical protein